MENQGQLNGPSQDLRTQSSAGTSLRVRPQYTEAMFPEVIDGPGSSQLLEYWDILRRRRGTLVLIAFLGLLSSLLLTLPQTPLYQARGSLEIQNVNENFLNMRNISPTASEGVSSSPEFDLHTQVKILQSESVLERVIAKLNLDNKLSRGKNNGRVSAWRDALGLPESRSVLTREEVLRLVTRNLTIRTESNTRLVEILYDSTDPQLAADFVNALTTEFIQQNVEARWKTSQQTGEWLTRQMEDVRIKLEKSEDELQRYANASGLLFTSEKDNVTEEKLRQLQEELSKAQGDRVAKQSRYELASGAPPESLPEVLDDKTLEEYEVKLTDLHRQLAELSSALTPAHPAVKKVQAQVTALESALQKERTNVIQRIRNEYESAHRRENLLGANYASQARLVSKQAAEVAHYNILKSDVDTDRQLYDSMLRSVQEAGMTSALSASNVRVVDPAKPPTHPYKPNFVLNSALGLLAGGFFGMVFVVMRERADRSIQAPGETALYLDLPELGVILSAGAEEKLRFPYLLKGRGADGQELGNRDEQVELVTSRGPSVLSDCFRSTLTSILCFRENGDRPRVIVLTSANPMEGKTTVASNLALALAELGSPVLLIDGDLRKGRLHEIFQVSNQWGLSDLLEGRDRLQGGQGQAIGTSYRHLYLLPAGSGASSISALLHSPRMLEFLNRMRKAVDTVIIDTPPMLLMPDARVLGRLADGVILVVRSAQTTREMAMAAAQRLTEDGTRVLGTILNEWDPRKTSRSDGYRYGYGYGYPLYHYHERSQG
jgi:polysaccharide biosynthesis transport protein